MCTMNSSLQSWVSLQVSFVFCLNIYSSVPSHTEFSQGVSGCFTRPWASCNTEFKGNECMSIDFGRWTLFCWWDVCRLRVVHYPVRRVRHNYATPISRKKERKTPDYTPSESPSWARKIAGMSSFCHQSFDPAIWLSWPSVGLSWAATLLICPVPNRGGWGQHPAPHTSIIPALYIALTNPDSENAFIRTEHSQHVLSSPR